MKKMTCFDFFSTLDFSAIFDEAYYSGRVNPELWYQYGITVAQEEGVELIDEDMWDYDTDLYKWYVASEKGLS